MGEEIIRVENLNFQYGSRLVLEDINLSIEKGDFLGVIGPNGCGKSTLLKLLVRILRPSGGEITLWGKKIENFKDWTRIGYLSQKATAFNSSFPATVEEVVGAHLFSRVGLFRHLGGKEKERIRQVLSLIEMEELAKSLIGNLSGGQQQRVFIARALVARPEVLLLDEPNTGIDSHTDEALGKLLAKLNQELGLTIIMVTHDLGSVTLYANKVARLSQKGLRVSALRRESDYVGDVSI